MRDRSGALRILVIADSKITVPPAGYGGAERIIAHLCEGLAHKGHRVTLMAAAGSNNYGRLITYPWAGGRSLIWRCYSKLNFLARSFRELLVGHDAILAACRTDYPLPFLRCGVPLLYRFGNPIELCDVDRLTKNARGPLALVAVSNHQCRSFSDPYWNTIYNGTDVSRVPFSNTSTGDYLAFIGRLTANKGVDTAIRIARKTKTPLKIAGNISDEPGGREFFEREVRIHLKDGIEWIGEIGDEKKFAFLRNSKALLAPIRWDEPCANVVMESLACGTPVIATAKGSMPELVRDGVNGFLASNEDQMVRAVARIGEISRSDCRRDAEFRFSTAKMVEKYLAILHTLHAQKHGTGRALNPQTSQ